MKKSILLLLAAMAITEVLNAQVFNTSSTLKKGQFSAGFEPGIYINGDNDFNLFLYGGAGLTNSIDFGIKLGVLGNNIYFGGDVEFGLGKIFSFSAGAHSWGNFGLDAMGLATFHIGNSIGIYTGLDLDIEFIEGDTYLPLMLPIGLEIPLKKNILFIFESEIGLSDTGYNFLGGGLNFIF
jgi:hypothetical protein